MELRINSMHGESIARSNDNHVILSVKTTN